VIGVGVVALVAGCAGSDADDEIAVVGSLATTASPPAATVAPVIASPSVAARSVAPSVDATPSSTGSSASISAVSDSATVTTPADRVDDALMIDWIGGSDVAWEQYSLPDEFVADLPAFAGRPLIVRTRTIQAAMPVATQALVEQVIADGTDAIIMSVNPVWLHWDERSCGDITVPHERYACLLTPTSSRVTAQRAAEIESLVASAAAAGVPVYLYTQPHSSDVLDNPDAAASIEAAEASLAAVDPGAVNVRFVSRVFTRDLPPMREGSEFVDMVHPTPQGAAILGAWLADDVAQFWTSVAFGAP
jgi:hypothetical protein